MTRANPEMLALARETRRLNQADLASLAGVTQGMISKTENGLRDLGDDALAAVAAALRYPVEFFALDQPVRGANAGVHHRRRAKLPAKDLAALEARMNVQRLRARRLLRGVEIDTHTGFPSLDVDEYGSPEESAVALRDHWRLPAGPVRNLTAAVEAAGGIVVVTSFGTRHLSGMSQALPGEPPFFFLNGDLPVDHRRMTLAHEVGHVVMHEVPSPRDPEDEAKRFAAELLMPADDIRDDLRRPTLARLVTLKLHWRVSVQALLIRARELDTLSERTYSRMQTDFAARGFMRAEPHEPPDEPATILPHVLDLHLGEHDYTVDELAALALSDPDEFRHDFLPGQPQLRLVTPPEEARPAFTVVTDSGRRTL